MLTYYETQWMRQLILEMRILWGKMLINLIHFLVCIKHKKDSMKI